MPSIIVKYAEPESSQKKDNLELYPLTFDKWHKQNFGIIPNNAELQYNDYLLKWYASKEESQSSSSSLKEDYLDLLKRISLIFKDDSDLRKFSNIDFNDNLQLKIAIPHFVRKIKEIAFYYKDKRESIRKAKLKYNMTGSFHSVERVFNEYIQKAFTKHSYVLNVPEQTAWNAFPDLSSVKNGFSIEIENLYDDTNYFTQKNIQGKYDLQPTNPLLWILEDIIEKEFNVKSSASVPLTARQIPLEFYECNNDFSINLQSVQLANERYIGTDKYYVTGGLFVDNIKNVALDFKTGNNFFYWFSGEYVREAPHKHFLPIEINNLAWLNDGATSSPYYTSSDLIFVKNHKNIEGAWFANSQNITVNDSMVANIKDRRFFKYPYPGIGLSSESLNWTGKLISDADSLLYNKTFFPDIELEENATNLIEELYWTTTDSISTVYPLLIHNSTLVNDGAYASKKFKNADKILTRSNVSLDRVHDTEKNEIFTGDYNVEWLYDFDRTELPITRGDNNIYWPLQTFSDINSIKFEYRYGDSVALKNLHVGTYFLGAVASDIPATSDMIFKLASWCGPIIEAAWLEGTPLSAYDECSSNTVTAYELLLDDKNFTAQFTSVSATSAVYSEISESWDLKSIPSVQYWWQSDWFSFNEDFASTTPQTQITSWSDSIKNYNLCPSSLDKNSTNILLKSYKEFEDYYSLLTYGFTGSIYNDTYKGFSIDLIERKFNSGIRYTTTKVLIDGEWKKLTINDFLRETKKLLYNGKEYTGIDYLNQRIEESRPTLKNLNTIVFDGKDDFLSLKKERKEDLILTNGQFSIILVFNTNDLNKKQWLFNNSSNPYDPVPVTDGILKECTTFGIYIKDSKIHAKVDKTEIISSNELSSDWNYIIVTFDKGNSRIILNGTESTGTLPKLDNLSNVLLGAGTDYRFLTPQNYVKNIQDIVNVFSTGDNFYGELRDFAILESISVEDILRLNTYLSNLRGEMFRRVPLYVLNSELPDSIFTFKELTLKESKKSNANILNRSWSSGVTQPGLIIKANPGEFTRFVWLGEGKFDFVNINSLKAFTGHEHDNACPYRNNKNKRPLNENLSFLEKNPPNFDHWKICNCNAIIYSPLGHNGNKFKDNDTLTDYIMLDTQYPNEFLLSDWRGLDGKGVETSNDFAWFKLDEDVSNNDIPINNDGNRIGWGKGKWISSNGSPFILKPGKRYIYFRNNIKRCNDTDVIGGNGPATKQDTPYFITKHGYCGCILENCGCAMTNCYPKWKRATILNGEWVDGGDLSEMTFDSNSFYTYSHKEAYNFSTKSNGIVISDCYPAHNFLISIPIKNSKPYWALGSFEENSLTLNKGLMYGGEYIRNIYDYLQITLPIPSSLILTDNLYFEYWRSDCAPACFVWRQPLTWNIQKETNKWNKLLINECVESDILTFIQRSNCEKCNTLGQKCPTCCENTDKCGCVIDECILTKIGLTASDETSDIMLKTRHNDIPVFVNYYARSPFTLTFDVTDTTTGIAPSGGLWIPPKLTNYVEAKLPQQNLVNLFDPIIAIDTIFNELSTSNDIGFFKPERLGYSITGLHKKVIDINIDTKRTINDFSIVLSPDHYSTGIYEVKSIDSSWMKDKSYCNQGSIVNASENQELVPYQTNYESFKHNPFGIENQIDLRSPWSGKLSNVFHLTRPELSANFRNEVPICCGPNTFDNVYPVITGTMVNWQTDVFGNQYGLYKDSYTTIYDRDNKVGNLWVKTLKNESLPANEALTRVYDTFATISSINVPLTSNNIINFEIFYDYLFLTLPERIVIERLNTDFSNGSIYSFTDASYQFDIVTYNNYAGTWFDEDDKSVLFAYLSGNFPVIYKLDINLSQLIQLYPNETTNVSADWDTTLVSNSRPLLSYNNINQSLNLTFKANSALFVSNFNKNNFNQYDLDEVMILEPELSAKELIKTSVYDDKLLLIFEEQTVPNKITNVNIVI